MRGKNVVAAWLLLMAVFGQTEAQGRTERRVSCLVLSEADPSSEAGRLVFERMSLEPELARWLPLRFRLEAGRFSAESSASVGYRLEKVTLLERRAGLGLYAVQASLAVHSPPRPDKKLELSFRLDELLALGGAIQPGQRALELAARRLGLSSGKAWIISIERLRSGTIKAVVGFDLA